MTDPGTTDEQLEAELAAAFADLRAPREVTDAAKGLFAWRTIDEDLAALQYDSLVDAEEGAVRSADGPRALSFHAGDVEIEIEIVPGLGGRRLVGQVEPGAGAAVELALGDRAVGLTADGLGRFATDLPEERVTVALTVALPAGRVRTAPIRV